MSAGFFALEIDGVAQAAFFDLTISTAVEPIETSVGGDAGPPQARPLPERVTLARQHSDDLKLFSWYQAVRDEGPVAARRDCAILVFDASGVTVGRYQTFI